MFRQRYQGLAAYNQWSNERLYEAVAKLPDEDFRRDCGAFFHSLHGTLNHLLVADRGWMARFRGEDIAPYTLDQILFDDFESLRKARAVEDERIIAFIDAQDENSLMATITYRTITNPKTITQPLAPALDHFFNHQTHHRGQAHALLTRLTGTAPSFDLIVLQRERRFDGLTAVD